MASLEELRERLDGIDSQIVELYVRRMKVCEEVGEYKVKEGRKVFDRQREKEKLADVASKVTGDFNKKGIQELYQQLMSMSRKLQYQQLVEAGALGRLPFIRIDDLDKQNARVVFQGTEGAYGQAAMRQFFGEKVNSFHVRTFRDAMEAILPDQSLKCMICWMNLKIILWQRQSFRLYILFPVCPEQSSLTFSVYTQRRKL